MGESIQTYPMAALRGVAILPGSVSHFDLTRDKSVRAAEHAMAGNNKIFLIAQKDAAAARVPDHPAGYYRTGVVAEVRQVVRLQSNLMRVIAQAEERARLIGIRDLSGCLRADVEIVMDRVEDQPDDHTTEAMVRSLAEALMDYSTVNQSVGRELFESLSGGVSSLDELLTMTADGLPLDFECRQAMLDAAQIRERYLVLMQYLSGETAVLRIKNELQSKVQERVDQNQKEYLLREQLKVIQEELGEDAEAELKKYREQVDALAASEEVKNRIRREIDRLAGMGGNVADANVSRNYIETLLELPWDRSGEDSSDMEEARRILEEDHYGLHEVKERVLEYLAVRNKTGKNSGPILCLVGPPGTGKTSIAKSVARALHKPYVRIGLGGVRDEAEIRGHRRTYVGAIPGRIAAGLRDAGVNNPLMLLDEVDKTGSDYRGDVSSALLELLDSEQNVNFSDHYIEMPVDMSHVLFIATANDMQAIPRPLLDRMEVIELSSYTKAEKMHIAKEHLIEKQRKENGLRKREFDIRDDALALLIDGYTREAGVRELERRIGKLCRRTAAEIYEGKRKSIRISPKYLEAYLGKPRYLEDEVNRQDAVGIACGLAWTSVGGVTMQIEVSTMPGKGELLLTGQLGDVMKESARAGLTYIRSVSEAYSIPADYFEKHDIHIHIPEGATPKDGPSAGISMTTAMLSAVTGRPVRADAAMTGEITLRGRVLPIGGLKEKLLAAKTAGICEVIVPERNRPDVEKIDKEVPEITEGMRIRYVSAMEEVLGIMLRA